jgi:tetratricopeptide (TPR) repeat protein
VSGKRNFLAAACIVLAAAAMFPSLRNGFTTWDDPQYVLENPLVRSLSPGSVVTMFTTPEYAGNYHPVTLLAIAAQYAAFGASPSGYHMVSLLLHIIATLLVYRIVGSLARSPLAAFAAAALFAVHPLHLEPVAWIADQKDLLCAVFYLGAVLAYVRYREGADRRRLYTAVLPLFALSLLSKGVAVTLPVVLLLVDMHRDGRVTVAALKEKLPHFALSVLFGVLAIRAQAAAGAMAAVEIDTPVEKLLYASQGYVLYIVKLFVPYGLSPWYPYPVGAPGYYWMFPLIAAGVAVAAIVWRKRAPMLFLGVAWYTVTVAPVLQAMQVGNAMMADRYAYLPSVGILLIMGWRFAAIVELYGKKKAKHLPSIAAGVYILTLAAFTFTLAPLWKDGATLWTRVIERYPTSAKGWFNRGHAYHNAGNFTQAVSDYDRTLELSPGYPYAWSNRGLSRLFLGDRARALEDFDRELRTRPADPDVRFWRANVLALIGRYDEAAADLTTVLESKPGNFEATVRRGLVYTASREFPKAEADFNAAISARPADPNLYFNRANVRAGMEQWDGAIADYSSVLGFNPADREAWYARGIAKFMSRDTSAACDDLRKASSLGAVQADTAIAEICIH